MAIKVNGTTVVDNARELANIASLDATTAATIGAAIGADYATAAQGATADAAAPAANPSFTGSITEEVFALTGTTPALDPANGTIQTCTLSGASTPTDGLATGESLTLMIDDGATNTITWPTMTWVNNAGAAPTLAATGYTVMAFWKVSTTLYGALVGDGS